MEKPRRKPKLPVFFLWNINYAFTQDIIKGRNGNMANTHKNTSRERRRRRRLAVVWTAAVLILVAVCLIVYGVYRVLRPEGPAGSESGGTSSTSSTSPALPSDTGGTDPVETTQTSRTSATTVFAGHYIQKDRSVWNLLLVNDYNPVPEGYLSTVTIADFNGPSKQCDSRIVEPLRRMINDGNAYDPSFRLSAASLYRTEELQAKNYNNKVNYYKNQGYDQEEAERLAATVIKRPGESEHNTGLCVDLLGAGYSSLEQSFANTEAYQWLKEHCAEYGFILRYPEDKEDITAVIFEPWHYRYVGVEAATEIMERGICLEEYLQEKGL